MGEVLYRAMAAACLATDGAAVGSSLGPVQLAVSISGGVEIAAVVTDLGGGGTDIATLNLDEINAYGTVNRGNVEQGLKRYWRGLVRFFRWAYRGPIPLYDHLGRIVGFAETGVFIGDGFGTAFYSVGVHEGYLKIQETLTALEEEMGVPANQRGFVTCIADDINIKGTTAAIAALVPLVGPILEPYGLRTNMSKSFFIGPRVHTVQPPPPDIPVLIDGGRTLGRPLGSLPSQVAAVERTLRGAHPPVEALKLIMPQFAFRLLKYCYSREFDYLHKVVPSVVAEHENDLFAIFDNFITDSIKDVLDFAARQDSSREGEWDTVSRLMIRHPAHRGGLGIPQISTVEGMRHRLVTYERAKAFLDREHPHWVTHLEQRYKPRAGGPFAGLHEGIEEAMQEFQGVEDRLRRFVLAGKHVVDEWYEVRTGNVYDFLVDTGAAAFAAQFLSSASTDSGGRWLAATSDPFIVGSPAVSGLEFCEAVRARVFAPFRGDGSVAVFCDCHEQGQAPKNLNAAPTHPEVCRKNANVRTACHDAVTKRLAALIKKASEPGVVVTLEPQVGPGERTPDIKVERNGHTTYIDVVVASPTSVAAVAGGSGERVGVAAALAEQRKRRDYQDSPYEVIPFAVENYGRLGQSASQYVNQLAPKITMDELARFYRDLSHILGFHLGRAHLMCRQRCRSRPEDA
jgi:hypothetical protein